MSSTLPFTLSTASLSESGYPDKDSFDKSHVHKLLNLPNGEKIDEQWLQKQVWDQAGSFQVKRTMQIRTYRGAIKWLRPLYSKIIWVIFIQSW